MQPRTLMTLAACAQQPSSKRIGVLMAGDETDSAAKALLSLFTQELSTLGWRDGGNMRTEVRWCRTGCEPWRKSWSR